MPGALDAIRCTSNAHEDTKLNGNGVCEYVCEFHTPGSFVPNFSVDFGAVK